MAPADCVFRLYWPVFWSATPQAEMAPVQDVSVVGFAFWARGSGMLVLTIQSALPAVSARVSSKSTRWTVAAVAGGAEIPVRDAAKMSVRVDARTTRRIDIGANLYIDRRLIHRR